MSAPILAAVSSNIPRIKYAAMRSLRELSERDPEALYPDFDAIAALLRSQHSVLRWNAILILGNLARIDSAGKIDAILDDYLGPIDGPHLIDAANTIHGATAIAAFKPHLADRIAGRILAVERATYATPECRNVAIGHAIDALARLHDMLADQRRVELFIERQTDNTRPATRKKAEKFLRLAHSA